MAQLDVLISINWYSELVPELCHVVKDLIGIVMCHPAIIEGAVHACCRVRISTCFCGFFLQQVTSPPFAKYSKGQQNNKII